MIKFTEAVKQYSEEKKARGLSGVVNAAEIARIRTLYKEGKFVEEEKKCCPQCGKEECECNKEMNEAQKKQYTTLLKEFREYKSAKGLGPGVSTKMKKMLERTVLMGTLTKPETIKETKDEKTILAGPVKLSESVKKDLRSNILEARKNIFIAKTKLKENDMMGAVDATQNAADAANAADAVATDPAMQGAVPQNIVDTVANIQAQVSDLAVQCGIQPPVDVNADPNAGVPAVDGSVPPAPAPAGGTPVMEGLASTKARLAKREAMLKAIKEGGTATPGKDMITQEIEAATNPQQFHDIDKSNSEELVVPTTKKSKEAANTWPTIKATYKESKTEEMITQRIKENEENWDFKRILEMGILG